MMLMLPHYHSDLSLMKEYSVQKFYDETVYFIIMPNVTKFTLLVQSYAISLLPCFIISDTYDHITSSLWVSFNHFRGVMKQFSRLQDIHTSSKLVLQFLP